MSQEEIVNADISKVEAALVHLKKTVLIARLYDLAQEIIDQRLPGETVHQVLINTNSAIPIDEKTFAHPASEPGETPAPAPEPSGPFKYYVMFLSSVGDTWPSVRVHGVLKPEFEPAGFDTVQEAHKALEKLVVESEDKHKELVRSRYYVLASNSWKAVPDNVVVS